MLEWGLLLLGADVCIALLVCEVPVEAWVLVLWAVEDAAVAGEVLLGVDVVGAGCD